MQVRNTVSRRSVLAGLGGAAAMALVAPRALMASAIPTEAAPRSHTDAGAWRSQHLAWVWQFSHDGDPYEVRETLAEHGLGIVLKTHDGSRWMGRYDESPTSIRGPKTVELMANFFENGGVPFHAWTVVKGRYPEREARLASQALDAGARSLVIDLEPFDGFWTGDRRDAWTYGEALRRLQPDARVSTSIDARPWHLDYIPLEEFAAFSDELAPQLYWDSFRKNGALYARAGDVDDPDAEVTPATVVASAVKHLKRYDLPISPIGDGTVAKSEPWQEFLAASYGARAPSVSVWRYGVADRAIWRLLKENPPLA